MLRAKPAVVIACTVASVGVLTASSLVASERLAAAGDALATAAPVMLAASACCFAAALAAAGVAWQAGLAACGARLQRQDAIARYAVGSLVNAGAPFRLGGAVRLALFARRAGVRATTATAAAVGAARSGFLGVLALAAGAAGLVPWWAAGLPALTGVAAVLVSVVVSRRRGVALGPPLPWIGVATAARLAGIALATGALGVERPLLVAFAVLPAVELAATLPLTPGNLGLGTVAAAATLVACGADATTALAAALACSLCETTASIAAGGAAALWLSPVRLPPLALPSTPVSACAR